ncbi:hypothetical protein ES703_94635 [subsurface metagenome]
MAKPALWRTNGGLTEQGELCQAILTSPDGQTGDRWDLMFPTVMSCFHSLLLPASLPPWTISAALGRGSILMVACWTFVSIKLLRLFLTGKLTGTYRPEMVTASPMLPRMVSFPARETTAGVPSGYLLMRNGKLFARQQGIRRGQKSLDSPP